MKLQYMSWLRNRAGKAREIVSPPPDVRTLAELVEWMCQKDTAYEALFSYRSIINASVNGQMVQTWDHAISADDEIIFFSPMAGG